jgi:hypothetical protein
VVDVIPFFAFWSILTKIKVDTDLVVKLQICDDWRGKIRVQETNPTPRPLLFLLIIK